MIKLAWRNNTTGAEGSGCEFPECDRGKLEEWIEATKKRRSDFTHWIEDCNAPGELVIKSKHIPFEMYEDLLTRAMTAEAERDALRVALEPILTYYCDHLVINDGDPETNRHVAKARAALGEKP